MVAGSEEEIYSIMFTSLKHPVRRKILRMLADKPMTFMQMVETLGVSTSHLTYHLESLGELLSKSEDQYYLSTFGQATVSAMKGVEEVPEIKVKHRLNLPNKWKALFAGLLVCIVLLSSITGLQYISLTQLASAQDSLRAENDQLLSWGIGTSRAASMLHDVAQVDISQYKTNLLSNTLEYRSDIGASEEVLRYSLTSSESNIDVILRFRDNHLSRYQLNPIESKPILSQTQPSNLLENAKATLERYKAYSGDFYLDEMISLLSTVNTSTDTEVMQGNMKLKITFGEAGSGELKWFYTEQGIDYSSKSLDMIFENWYLKELTDGYFLFSIGTSNLEVTQDEAVVIAKNYVKGLTWNIEGTQVSGFNVLDEPVSVQLAPHPRTGSSGLIPYWYIVLRLDKTYAGGINTVTVGIYADNGEVQHVQMLSA
jgi:DNA-binding transcriptional ArsR family regulator